MFLGKSKKLPKAFASTTCSLCVGGIESVLSLVQAGLVGQGFVHDAAISACSVVLDKAVCEGAVNNYLPEIWHIVTNNPEELSGGLICALIVGGKCGKWEEANSWTIEIPGNKPEVIKPTLPQEGSPTTKILHLTDIHLDLSYTVGTNTECGQPLCCTNNTEVAPSDDLAAGYWGSYSCDVPTWTFEDMLMHIREKHLDEIEYIMMTGDNPPHDVWLQSREGNLDHSRKVVELINKVFPDREVIYTLGNHESFPCNSFPPVGLEAPEFNPSWFYEAIANIYSEWLPTEAANSMATFGRYSFLMRPGFRVIVINSNPCLTYNFWVLFEREDMNGELAWLVQELLAAETNGELVHIISHIPPGNHDCIGAWGREYSRIIDRFENTIMAQFYGHTHNDEFIVFYDTETNTRPTNIGHLTPSVSSYSGYNMAYRFYTIDGFYPGNSLRVLDTETYIFNLASANLQGPNVRPEYFKYYEGRKDLGLKALFPEDYDDLARRMASDEIFYEKYLRYYNKGGPGGGKDDKRDIICSMVRTSFIDDRKCDEIMGPL